MKYIFIAIKDPDDDSVRELPFIFPNACVHSDMFNLLKKSPDFENCEVTCVSAGFYTPGNRQCSGRSDSLDIDSRPTDMLAIMGIDYSHGFV